MSDPAAIAAHILDAHDRGRSIDRLSDTYPGFSVTAAYQVSREIVALRVARGERPVGWKIGYTNRAVQQRYGVLQPIWGRMYDTTVNLIGPGAPVPVCDIGHIAEPRIEPEIVVRLARSPEPGMGPADLAGCIDAVGHGFEVVTSVYRDWRGDAADSIAAGSLHGRYYHRPLVPVTPGREWVKTLADVEVTLYRNGTEIERGRGVNALDGPLSALAHFVNGMAGITGERVKAGEIVTTGTLTEAFRVASGETWTTEIRGLAVEGMALSFR